MSNQQGWGPPPPASAFSPEPRRNTALIVTAVAAGIAVIALIGITLWIFVLDPGPSPTPQVTQSPTTATTTRPATLMPLPTTEPPPATSQPPPPPPRTEPPAQFPVGARPCFAVYAPVGGYTASAIGNDVTSCPFAEEVRLVYAQQPVRDRAVVVDAFSPVTGNVYTMTCQGGRLVTCTGGNNAVVHLR